ncbi:hypothetical protein TELCIR_04203 [Teladorsagia circumcincta]|uniref:Uncharacterized protein n=1 Tax=Teladorsagia circumcincta TaxID=45464 RepID=A0A2G9UU83_TELCI|nr:hypothetical protein TELCIR_04203 [Teladorsagia circumcincta]
MIEECKLQQYLGLPEKCDVDRFARVFTKYKTGLEPMLMIASLCENQKDIESFHRKTKLSNAERILGEFIVTHRKEAEQALSNKNVDWWKDMIVELEVTPGHGMFSKLLLFKYSSIEKFSIRDMYVVV